MLKAEGKRFLDNFTFRYKIAVFFAPFYLMCQVLFLRIAQFYPECTGFSRNK
jgi:hypothetical protein